MPPNMTPDELARWQTKQIEALIAIGINPLDAHSVVTRFVAKLPPGADPDHYVPYDGGAGVDVSSKEVLADVRAWWYGNENVDARYKRLLDAKGAE